MFVDRSAYFVNTDMQYGIDDFLPSARGDAMDLPDIFAATLGLSTPWQITDVSFAPNEKRMDITVAFNCQETINCPHCGSTSNMCQPVDETWFHNDFFNYATYLHTQIPFVPCCAISPIERPWCRTGSKFALLD